MEHQRPALGANDIETGFADVLQPRVPRSAPPHASPPAWLTAWETKRPTIFVELFAEWFGVFLYVYFGVGATAAFFLTTVAKEAGFGSLLTIGLAYGVGIVFALVCVVSTSGGHLSPGYTIAFTLFKGFPAWKAPLYIAAQIFGGFCAAICVYGQYKQQFDTVYAGFVAAGLGEIGTFTPTGPAGVFALFPQAGQASRYLFLNEFMTTLILAVIVFAVLDASNFLVNLASAPFIIGFAYSAIIWAFVPGSISLNTARDLGGRCACAAIYGNRCFTAYPKYTAIAALVNIAGSICGAFIQTLFLSDSARKLLNVPPMMQEIARSHNEKNGHSDYDAASMGRLSRALSDHQARTGQSFNQPLHNGNGNGIKHD